MAQEPKLMVETSQPVRPRCLYCIRHPFFAGISG